MQLPSKEVGNKTLAELFLKTKTEYDHIVELEQELAKKPMTFAEFDDIVNKAKDDKEAYQLSKALRPLRAEWERKGFLVKGDPLNWEQWKKKHPEAVPFAMRWSTWHFLATMEWDQIKGKLGKDLIFFYDVPKEAKFTSYSYYDGRRWCRTGLPPSDCLAALIPVNINSDQEYADHEETIHTAEKLFKSARAEILDFLKRHDLVTYEQWQKQQQVQAFANERAKQLQSEADAMRLKMRR